MSEKAVVRVEAGRRSGWIYGAGSVVVPALKLVRCPRQWDEVRRGWMVPISQLSDALAALEYRYGANIELSQVDR